MADEAALESIFSESEIEAVLHFAAYCYVGESVTDPLKYYANNTASVLPLLRAMQNSGTDQFVLSSTCATYGNPREVPMTEKHPQEPINPYGMSKLMLERILADCGVAFGLRSVFLRYFNACGCSVDGKIGEDHDPETHLIPLALMAVLGDVEKLTIFGTDYPTADGTCIRDYIHVLDLADAHVRALRHLREGGTSMACNLGTGTGTSVKELLAAVQEVTGRPVPHETGARREGDPPELVADPSLAKKALGWEALRKSVKPMIEDAWRWMNGPGRGRYAK
jgi:UDP-glucose-4-epimerase GalE